MRKPYVFWSHWHPNSNGSDYWEALGFYEEHEVETRTADAQQAAWDRYEEPTQEEQDEDGMEDCGPEYLVEEYDPDKHDNLKSGGGSFQDEFDRMH